MSCVVSTPNRSRETNLDLSEINAAIGDVWYQPSPEIFVQILVKKRHEISSPHALHVTFRGAYSSVR